MRYKFGDPVLLEFGRLDSKPASNFCLYSIIIFKLSTANMLLELSKQVVIWGSKICAIGRICENTKLERCNLWQCLYTGAKTGMVMLQQKFGSVWTNCFDTLRQYFQGFIITDRVYCGTPGHSILTTPLASQNTVNITFPVELYEIIIFISMLPILRITSLWRYGLGGITFQHSLVLHQGIG